MFGSCDRTNSLLTVRNLEMLVYVHLAGPLALEPRWPNRSPSLAAASGKSWTFSSGVSARPPPTSSRTEACAALRARTYPPKSAHAEIRTNRHRERRRPARGAAQRVDQRRARPRWVLSVLNGGDTGLLRSLDHLSAAAASAPSAGGPSIAAHVEHLRYGLSLMNRWAAGENPFPRMLIGRSRGGSRPSPMTNGKASAKHWRWKLPAGGKSYAFRVRCHTSNSAEWREASRISRIISAQSARSIARRAVHSPPT